MSKDLTKIKNDIRIIISEVGYELGEPGFKNPGYKKMKEIAGMTSISAIRESIDFIMDSYAFEFGYNNTVIDMLSKIK